MTQEPTVFSSHSSDVRTYREALVGGEVKQIFSEEGRLRSWLLYEVALARAQAELGMIPGTAADQIELAVQQDLVTPEAVAETFVETGLETAAFVKVLTNACSRDAKGYVHWGSTTTDIVDTGLSLQLKGFRELLGRQLESCRRELVLLIDHHRHTLMVGRTHSQHALPLTFGYIGAVWLDELTAHVERLDSLWPRLLVAKVSGAVGSQAAFGPRACELPGVVARILGLNPARIGIQISRAQIQEFLFVLSLIGNTLAHLAKYVWTRQRPEIGELAEHYEVGRSVGSTTLAAKRNPFQSEWIIGQAITLRSNAGKTLQIVPEDERDGTRYSMEYVTIAESCRTIDSMLSRSIGLLQGLEVNSERMKANLASSDGLVMCENVMMSLAARGLGRDRAYELVYRSAHQHAMSGGQSFVDVLWSHQEIRQVVTVEDLTSWLDPEQYLGTVQEQIDDTIQRWEASRAKQQ